MTNEPTRKWEWWANGRRRSRTIAVRLWPDSGDLSISARAVASNGCMSELNSFSCDVEHLPKLVHALNRALAVATDCGLIKQLHPRSWRIADEARSCAPQ
jgi:hypothetical protein